mmetsp:Transcript_17378/g.27629  ORF Transcript_17378/g.27629 Transcript_17378/m.27629 type:complete len:114 (-) Transcript_17378:4353-4694(-)
MRGEESREELEVSLSSGYSPSCPRDSPKQIDTPFYEANFTQYNATWEALELGTDCGSCETVKEIEGLESFENLVKEKINKRTRGRAKRCEQSLGEYPSAYTLALVSYTSTLSG